MKLFSKFNGKQRKSREVRDVRILAEYSVWQKQQHERSILANNYRNCQQTEPQKSSNSRDKDIYCNAGSFHVAAGRILLIAEFFALMPVKGVTAATCDHLSFSWSGGRTIYSLGFIVLLLLDLGLAFNKVFDGSINFNAVEPIIFRCSILIVCISSLNLAGKWPKLMHIWNDVEKDLPPFTNAKDKYSLRKQIRMVTYMAITLSFLEHILSLVSVMYYGNHCPVTEDPIKNFFLISGDELYYVLPYSIWLAILNKIHKLICTFVWNYMDIFVMIMGIALAEKFRQLNLHLMKFKGMQMPELFWQEHRIKYRNLCILSEKIDNQISLITVIAFSNNFYFICVQLLKSLNEMPHIALASYFYYSLLFLFGRSLAVSLYSANVYDESRKPLKVLRAVPEESWCMETRRFSHEITSSLVALSGMKFFYLTRQIVLAVTGSIITYVLVLIQFHSDEQLWECDNRFDRLLKNII